MVLSKVESMLIVALIEVAKKNRLVVQDKLQSVYFLAVLQMQKKITMS